MHFILVDFSVTGKMKIIEKRTVKMYKKKKVFCLFMGFFLYVWFWMFAVVTLENMRQIFICFPIQQSS